MRTTLIPVLCMVLFAMCLATAASEQSDELRVQYRYASFPAYMEHRQPDGTMGPPDKQVLFGKEMQATHALRVTIGQKSITCPVMYQDAAYLLDDGKKKPIRILAYGGCPFQIGELAVMKDIVLRERTILTIEAAEKDILYLSKESALPWAVGQFRLLYPCANVVNVVWKFSKPGISFQTPDAVYTSTKTGATITFTEAGVKMDGIREDSGKDPSKKK